MQKICSIDIDFEIYLQKLSGIINKSLSIQNTFTEILKKMKVCKLLDSKGIWLKVSSFEVVW